MKALDDLIFGADCAVRGIKVFFSRPRLWPYALPPLAVVLLLYAGILGYFFPQYGQTAPSGPVITVKVFRHLLSVHFFFI